MIEFTSGEVVTTGKGTFAIHAFYRRDLKDREQPIHEAEKDDRSGIPKTEKILEIIPSGLAMNKKFWTTRRHNYPEGSYLKFIMRRTMPSGTAFQRAMMTAVVLRVRDTAPLNLIEIDLPCDNNSAKARLYINGRFDILDVDTVEAKGLHISATGSNELHLFESLEDDDKFIVTMQEKAKTVKAAPKLQRVTGTKSIPKLRRSRRVGLVD